MPLQDATKLPNTLFCLPIANTALVIDGASGYKSETANGLGRFVNTLREEDKSVGFRHNASFHYDAWNAKASVKAIGNVNAGSEIICFYGPGLVSRSEIESKPYRMNQLSSVWGNVKSRADLLAANHLFLLSQQSDSPSDNSQNKRKRID